MSILLDRYLKQETQDADTVSLHPNAMQQTQGSEEEEEELTPIYRWWHNKLADYFEMSENYDRKVEVRNNRI